MKLEKYSVIRNILLTMLVFVFQSCDRQEIIEKYTQTIPNSNIVIYIVNYNFGGIPPKGNQECLIIADSNETIDIDSSFSLGTFKKRPTSSNIEMVDLSNNDLSDKDSLLTPLSTDIKKIGNIQLKITTYRQTFGAPVELHGRDYNFADVSETADSLIFTDIEDDGVMLKPGRQAFVKGNIKVVERDDKSIEYISIKEFVIKRGDVYYPKSPFEIVHNRPIVGSISYCFYPKKRIYANRLSNNGIFKKAEIK